jgi:hypothetical protein
LLNTLMESHNAEVRAYEDLKDKLEDVIENELTQIKCYRNKNEKGSWTHN